MRLTSSSMKRMVLTIIVLVFLLLAYSLIEPYFVQVNEVEFVSPHLPREFDGVRIVFASDIHCGQFFSTGRLKELVGLIDSLKPDMVLLGGDYVLGGAGYIPECVRELKSLHAPLGVFAVLGNHDNWAGAELTKSSLEDAGITVLDNKAMWVTQGGARIKVGGVGDLWTESQNISPTIGDTKEGDFIILMSHNPAYADEVKDLDIGLIVSGHTHGGQILPVTLLAPHLPSRLRQKYVAGVFDVGGSRLIVTKGVGMVFVPVRFLVRPEVVVITLRMG
ncbi:MAG: metallophosphoesterase [Candidatus Altiarchaeota archaeon]